MSLKMTPSQRQWFDGEKDQKRKLQFCSTGEVETQSLMHMKTFKEFYVAMVKGVRISKDYATKEEAIKAGEAEQKEFLEKTKDLPPLPEDLSDEFQKITKKVVNSSLRIEKIHFLGQYETGEVPGDHEYIIEALEDNPHESLKELADKFKEETDFDCDDLERLSEAISYTGFYGIMIEAATPVKDFRGRDSGYGYSWSNYYTQYIYGDTINQAFDRALEWAEQMKEKDRDKARNA